MPSSYASFDQAAAIGAFGNDIRINRKFNRPCMVLVLVSESQRQQARKPSEARDLFRTLGTALLQTKSEYIKGRVVPLASSWLATLPTTIPSVSAIGRTWRIGLWYRFWRNPLRHKTGHQVWVIWVHHSVCKISSTVFARQHKDWYRGEGTPFWLFLNRWRGFGSCQSSTEYRWRCGQLRVVLKSSPTDKLSKNLDTSTGNRSSQVKTTSSYWQSRTAVEHLSVENHFKTSFPKANNQVADLGQWHFSLYNPSKTKALPRLSCVLASVKGCTVLSRMVCMERWIEGATEEYQQATNRAPTGFFQGTDIDCLLLDD